jgi:hypothetical protein
LLRDRENFAALAGNFLPPRALLSAGQGRSNASILEEMSMNNPNQPNPNQPKPGQQQQGGDKPGQQGGGQKPGQQQQGGHQPGQQGDKDRQGGQNR